MTWFFKIVTFDFGGTPSQIENSRQVFLIRFFAVVGSIFLIPLGIHSIFESRYWLGIILIGSAAIFIWLLRFAKEPKQLVKLRMAYCALISLLTLYLILTGGAMGTGIYYAFSLCMLIISYAGHKHGMWISVTMVTLLSIGLYNDYEWLYSYEYSHKIRIILGISLIFMMMLIFEWMRMRSYHALSIQSEDYRHNSVTDSLTGIYNRKGLEQHFNEWQRSEFPAVFAIIDIDHFKLINDTHGHHAGDLALIAITQTFRQHIKGKDLLARWGGEEFALVFARSNTENMVKVIDDIRSALKSNMIEYGQSKFTLSISAGVSSVKDKDDLQRALLVADERLYTAKNDGRDRVVAS